jgi:hypothetical protein
MAPSKIANARYVYMSTTLSDAEAAKFMEWLEQADQVGGDQAVLTCGDRGDEHARERRLKPLQRWRRSHPIVRDGKRSGMIVFRIAQDGEGVQCPKRQAETVRRNAERARERWENGKIRALVRLP